MYRRPVVTSYETKQTKFKIEKSENKKEISTQVEVRGTRVKTHVPRMGRNVYDCEPSRAPIFSNYSLTITSKYLLVMIFLR